MSAPARRADDQPEVPEQGQARAGAADALALEALLDELVRELYTVGLGVAGALRQVEGHVAERLTGVLEDADRLIRTVHSAAATLRAEPAPRPEESPSDLPAGS